MDLKGSASRVAGLISYVKGDATRPAGGGQKVIVHCCNDLGLWGAGFVVALGSRFPESRAAYLGWFSGSPPALGEIQVVRVRPDLEVVNLIGQHGISAGGPPPIRYEAVRDGLRKVRAVAIRSGASVHMPRMGAGLAGGSWPRVEEIVEDELCSHGVPVTVYDPPGMDDARAARDELCSALCPGGVPPPWLRGVGVTREGAIHMVKVNVRELTDDVRSLIPPDVGGVPVVVEAVGDLVAL